MSVLPLLSYYFTSPRRHPDWCHRQLFPSTPTRAYHMITVSQGLDFVPFGWRGTLWQRRPRATPLSPRASGAHTPCTPCWLQLRGACLMRQRPTKGAWVPRSFTLRFGMATSAASCFHMLIVGTRISEDKPPCTLYLWPGSTPQSCISWLSLNSASGQGVLPSQVACVYHLWPMSTPQPLLLLMFHVIKRLTRPNALR